MIGLVRWVHRIVPALLLAWACAGTAATIVVAPSGSDSTGDGSLAAPYQTIQYALDQSGAGDTIVLRGGTYDEAIRIRNANITIQPYQGEHAHIHAPTDDEALDTAVLFDVDADGGTLEGLEISGGYYYGVMLFTRWDWGDPEDRTGVSHITIRNCTIHHTGRDCIKITPGCDYVTIDGCEIHHSGVRDNSNAEGIDNVNGDSMVVRDCSIHDTATTGVYTKGGAMDAVIERCVIENCGALGVALGFDTSPEYFDLTVNPDRFENIRGIVRNCLIRNTVYAGIAFYAAKDAAAYNNTVIHTAQAGHSPIYFGVTLQDWEPDPDPNDGIGYRPASVHIRVVNNIVVQEASDPATCVFIRTFYHEGDVGRVNGMEGMPEMDHNCYWCDGRTPTFTDERPGYEMTGGSLADWQVHTGYENHSIATDPLLDGSGRPLAGSPCIDAGDSSVPVSDDLDGTVRTAPFDIGAVEVAATQPPQSGTVFYLPHIAHRNYSCFLIAYATGNVAMTFDVDLFGEDGTSLGREQYRVSPHSQLAVTLSDSVAGQALSARITLTDGTGMFKCAYLNASGGMAEFVLDGTLSARLVYLFPSYNGAVTWNGLACWNGSDTPAQVVLTAYHDGLAVGVQTVTLAAKEKLVGVVGDGGTLLESLNIHGFDMIVAQTSSSSLCGLNISGDGQEKLVFTPAVAQPAD